MSLFKCRRGHLLTFQPVRFSAGRSIVRWTATAVREASTRFRRVTFLDHALRHGDSLVGLTLDQIRGFHWQPQKQLGYPVGGQDWVFVSRTGKLKAPNALIKAIEMSEEEANVKTHVTPHQMRYPFSDLLRHAQVDKVTRKAMIGHVTDEMQEHYSTVNLEEKREAMQAVAAKLKEVRLTVLDGGRGYHPQKREAVGSE